MKFTVYMCDGHITEIFTNFKEFPLEFSSFKGISRSEVKFHKFFYTPGISESCINAVSLLLLLLLTLMLLSHLPLWSSTKSV